MWASASHYPYRGYLCCLHGTNKERNQQGSPRRYQLRCGIYRVRFLYRLCTRLHQEDNDFSSDISTASLDLGTKIMHPDSDSQGKDSVDLIWDSLFSYRWQQPWLLLQFGNSDIEEIGADRVEALVSVSPSADDGATREDVVKTEIEDNDNDNLTIPQVINRLGMVFFLLIFNLGITIFVFLLTGMMIFSQSTIYHLRYVPAD